MTPLQYRSHAKCLILGAHSVLRGASAISYPLPQYYCKITWIPQQGSTTKLKGIDNPDLKSNLHAFLKHCLAKTQNPNAKLEGTLHIENTIPIACNLGSSAALCLNISKLFVDLQFIHQNYRAHFAIECEHFFHGVSSGFDLKAVSCPNNHILLLHQNQYEIIKPLWNPSLHLIKTAMPSNTKEAIEKVYLWQQQQWDNGNSVDKTMHHATLLALRALTQPALSCQLRHEWFQQALDNARLCYQNWGLVSKDEIEIMHHHREQFCSVNPVGAGGGGYLLGLAKSAYDKPKPSSDYHEILVN